MPTDDRRLIEEHIKKHGVIPCPSAPANGTDYYRPNAKGRGKIESLILPNAPRCTAVQNLAQAKIITMFQDLVGISYGENVGAARTAAQRHACRWFFHHSERADFEAWCDAAGYEPDWVRRKAQHICDNGLPELRARAGTGKDYERKKRNRDLQKLKKNPAAEATGLRG